MKTCRTCGEEKSLDAFYPSRQKSGKAVQCKACQIAQAIERMKNPERRAARNLWANEYAKKNPDKIWEKSLRRYGITLLIYNRMLTAQGDGCAICGVTIPVGRGARNGRFSIDHDHSCCPDKTRSCGKCVRGLLCSRCNTMFALALDNPDVLIKGAAYLRDASSCPEGDEMEVEEK